MNIFIFDTPDWWYRVNNYKGPPLDKDWKRCMQYVTIIKSLYAQSNIFATSTQTDIKINDIKICIYALKNGIWFIAHVFHCSGKL